MQGQPCRLVRILKVVAVPRGIDCDLVGHDECLAELVVGGQVILLVVRTVRLDTNAVGAGSGIQPTLVEFEPTASSARHRWIVDDSLVRGPCAVVDAVAHL